MSDSPFPRVLPPLPRIDLVALREHQGSRPYLTLKQLELVARFPDGKTSEPFRYTLVERRALDAVVVAPHFTDTDGKTCVLLRSALRPPAKFRPREVWPIPEKDTLGGLWELPAGLVEEDERSEAGLRSCAARELYEETGAQVEPAQIFPLGPSTFPAPGVIGERHFFFHALIDPARVVPPVEDGSVLEQQAVLAAPTLADALALVRAGQIEDAKTEIGLRRLAELLA
jgi:ADP-ribose pyrophosphatase